MPMSSTNKGAVMKKLSTFFKRHGWCQGANARLPNKQATVFYDKHATEFCINGAAHKLPVSTAALNCFIRRETKFPTISSWNDAKGRTKKQVIAMCEKFEKSLKHNTPNPGE